MTTKMQVFEGLVTPDWIDYNGHMNDACYVVVFSKAIDEFMRRIGLDDVFRAEHQVSIYTLQSMVHYLQEVSEGEPLRIEVQLLEKDRKRCSESATDPIEFDASGLSMSSLLVAKLVESFGRRGDSPKVLTTFATNELVNSMLTNH